MDYTISLRERTILATENLSKMPKPTSEMLMQRWEMVKMKSKAKDKKRSIKGVCDKKD